MAFRFNGTNNSLEQTTTLPSNAWTMCAWVRPNAMGAASDLFLSAGNTTARTLSFGVITGHVWSINDTGGTFGDFPIAPQAGEWWFAAMTHDGANCRGFTRRWDHRALQFATIAAAALTLTSMKLGNSTFDATDWADGRAAGFRIWGRVMLPAELMQESMQLAPRNMARLHTWAREDSRVDQSGFSRTLTAAGTVTREQGPPVRLYSNPTVILDHVNTTAAAASADISSAGSAVATLSTQSLASANLSSTAAASAVFASNATAPANLTSAGSASMVLATNVLAKADLSSAGAASAAFTSQSSASANLSMAGAATGTLASAALASVALSMAGTATAIFEASAQAQGQADLSIAGSSSAVFGAQAVASADIAAAGSASAVFGATSTGGAVVETPAPPSQAVGGPGGGGRSKRRKRHDEELALIAEAMGGVFEKMVRGELIEGEIEIDLRRTLH